MKIFYIFSFAAIASAAIIPFEGLRQQNDTSDKITEPDQNLDATIFNDEGYKYKSVRHLKYRQRRDISVDVNAYLPPSDNETIVEKQINSDFVEANEYLPPSEEVVADVNVDDNVTETSADPTILGADGYEYKTVRRLKYRQRRDVSEIANEYLPPTEKAVTESAVEVKSVEEPEESAALGADGYEYKTVRRLKYRQRRDVSEIANEYLPPTEEAVTESVADVKSVEEPEESAILGADGYEYKTVRRLKYRQRRDVSEIANEYLPPTEEAVTESVAEIKSVEEPVAELKSVEEPEESAILGADGYEYKTVRRLKYRQRRDVSEIANEYLPPTEEAVTESVAEVKSVEEPEESAVLGADGYEYKTVRRLKYRQRRDVSEIANEYLPPTEEAVTESVAEIKSVEELVAELKSVEEPQDSAVLGADGYEYKTVRRLKYRQRRDVSEIANEYLPPTEEAVTESVADAKSVEEPEESAILGADGYEYKTVRRLKYRQRRDVSEIANEYLPPAEEAVTESVAEIKSVEEPVAELKSVEEPEETAILGADGYEYKTVRRLKYRQRRDVSEIANEYLPPTEEAVTEVVAEVKSVEEPEETAILGADGYEYKTVRRLKYRQRRDVSEIANEYLPPTEEAVTESVAEVKSVEEPEESAVLGADGYEYKTVRRLKYRQRRDVSEIANEYLPPTEETVTEVVAEIKSVEEPEESAVLGADGYEYKTVRRLKYRQRRDVSEIANEYLPPTEETVTESVADVKSVEEPEESAILGADGYEYKTVRRLKYRQRRDVSEIANEYLPPTEEAVTEVVAEVKSVEEPEETAILGADGYEYKTVRRLKYRQRRDVSEIANEYLPPAEEAVTESVAEIKSVEEPVAELKSVEEPEESAILGADGYEYKTVRRLKYRQRRDVSEIANEYLPPTEEAVTESVAEVKSVEEPEESAVLGADGYEYKTVRRLKYRQRRDVSEIANEYLPPTEEAVTESVADVKSVEEPEESAILGADGYEYKTVRRLKYRQRRDVSEIANEYLPPTEEAVTESVADVKSVEEPEESAILGADGYEYKTVRRLKYRQRRDVSEIANEYLPPAEEAVTESVAETKSVEEPVAELKSVEEPQDSAVLGADGYEYKTVRRLKYRQRRDVSEIANEYLPPTEEAVTEVKAEIKSVEEPEESAVLGADGYEYKTVRRLKYRQRRDVSEIANEYLPPTEEAVTESVAEVKSIEEPEESAVLGADGYEYKTVRRLKYRQRRDVSEIANEYLPPTEEAVTEVVAEVKSVEEPEETAILGADGYEYKTVRRLKYRQRRDVSEIANEYLPPTEEAVTESVAEVKSIEVPEDSAVLGADGYEYKTVRRLKYRQRRDVSEIANEYLPPTEEAVTESVAEVKSVEEPEESAVLGADGYEYKTVRQLKYRQRRDVSEIANEYLPPAEEEITESLAEVKSVEEPEESAVLGADGYEYKTVRQLKYRQRRDVSEIANEYLPPAEEAVTESLAEIKSVEEPVAELKSVEEPQDSAVLGADGYEYKTVRRLKYRQRRDVSEIENEYLPPTEEAVTEVVAELKSVEEPEESAVLGADGYEYKTVRRLKYRQRRDVSEIANEYLPPTEEAVTESVAEVKSVEEPEESAVLGADGYEYKTVRRLKYRHRRDVSEIANEYLPPIEEAVTEVVAELKSVEEPKESAVLGADGYEYKTVRRLKYRQRRDVSEIANEYLPPTEEAVTESVAEVKSVEEPEESAVLGADGYEYKTVRRLKYRQRRDVSEIANEYLPPTEEAVTEVVAELKSVEEPEESAVLGADGYEYKTVRRLKYRQRL